MVIELHHQQLTSTRLEELTQNRSLPALIRNMDFSQPDSPAVVNRTGQSVAISLTEFCVDLFVRQATEDVWGPALLKSEPNLIKAFMDWEYTNWKFMFRLPSLFAKDMLTAKNTIAGAFTKYCRVPRNERLEASYFATALEDVLREVGLTDDEMGKSSLLHYWA
jgi:hypothetical protein